MLMMNVVGVRMMVQSYLPVAIMAGKIHDRANCCDLIGQLFSGSGIPVFAHIAPYTPTRPEAVETRVEKVDGGNRLTGMKSLVPFAAAALHYIVVCRLDDVDHGHSQLAFLIFASNLAGLSREDCATLNGRAAPDMIFNVAQLQTEQIVELPQGASSLEIVSDIVDDAILADRSEAGAIVRQRHQQTLDYDKQREEFARSIGSFQAIQRRLVEMYTEAQIAQLIVEYAAAVRYPRGLEAQASISAANAGVGKVLKFVGQNTVQFHGGMGRVEELALAQYFGRASFIDRHIGAVDQHFARFESRGCFDATVA